MGEREPIERELESDTANQHNKDDKGPSRWRPTRAQVFWLFAVISLFFAINFFNSMPKDERVLHYSEYREYLLNGSIREATVIGETELKGVLDNNSKFVVNLGPIDAETTREWVKLGLNLKFKEKPFLWSSLLINFLPWVLFIVFWIFMLRQMQGGSKGLFSFGKSKAKLLMEDKHKTTFEDVAGVDEAKQELGEIIEFLSDPKKFQRLGGRIPKGVLLVGPPGTGKTHIARAVAGEAGVPFFSISGSDFVEMFVGVGASRVRDLFEQGKANAPCIIFVDEIDAVGRQRGAGIGGGHDEREQTLNQLLVEMDGFEANDGVILVAATNRPDVLDPALLRPGRFDRNIIVDLPDVRGREGILKVHTRKIPITDEVDMKRLAQGTPGFSGADLANLVNEAALLASRYDRTAVGLADFEYAKDKVMLGPERKSMVMNEEERKLTAYHEAGHALVAKLLPGARPIHKAMIIPRGRALGLVAYLDDERLTSTKTKLEAELATGLGGRCAEELVFAELTNGAQGDYRQVTALARRMICDWGMNKNLGPLYLGKEEDEVFLGKDFSRSQTISEKTAQTVDNEIRELVFTAEEMASNALKKNEDKLHALAKALLEYEVLDDQEIDQVIAGHPLLRTDQVEVPNEEQVKDESGLGADTSEVEPTDT